MSDLENYVYAEKGTDYCLFCDGSPQWGRPESNDIFLCGPGHSPLNAEANYICREHLDHDAVISSSLEGFSHQFDLDANKQEPEHDA